MTEALLIVLAVAFLVTGASKLAGVQATVDNFERWHLPPGSRQVVGITELLIAVLAVIGLWDDLEARLAATLAILTMLGALATHLSARDRPRQIAPAVVLLVVAIVLRATI